MTAQEILAWITELTEATDGRARDMLDSELKRQCVTESLKELISARILEAR